MLIVPPLLENAGAAVAERAGRNVKKVVLELGGSDPFVVLPDLSDAELDHAAKMAVIGRMITTGQTCVCSKRFIVIGKEKGKAFLGTYTCCAKLGLRPFEYMLICRSLV